MPKPAMDESGAERRTQVRFPIDVPVRLTLFTSPRVNREDPTKSLVANAPLILPALALDVSEYGLKLEIVGVPLKAILDSSDPLVRLEVRFMQVDLRYIGPCPGHAQWRRGVPERDTWAIGARFDAPFKAEDLSRLIRSGASAPTARWVLALVVGAVALLLAAGWYRAHTTYVAERETTLRHLSTLEGDLAETRSDLERWRALQSACPSAPALLVAPSAAAPSPAAALATVWDAATLRDGEGRDSPESDAAR